MSTEAVSALVRLVAKQGQDIVDLQAKVAVLTERSRATAMWIESLPLTARVGLIAPDDETPKERRRRYQRTWMRNKRSRLRDGGDIDAVSCV
jgi:hypothetical protein